MDNKNDNQEDMTVNSDGNMVAADDSTNKSTGPEVNEISPPPPSDKSDLMAESAESTVEESVSVESAPDTNIMEVKAAPDEKTEESLPEENKSSSEQEKIESINKPEAPSDNSAPAVPEEKSVDVKSENQKESHEPLHHEHRNNRKFIAIVTVLVAIILAGAAIYVYISAQSNTEEVPVNNSTSDAEVDGQDQSAEESTPVSTEDLDQTLGEVDSTLDSLDDSSDFSEEPLTDDTLGI